jgi:SAM-dependent methyltransferase
MTTSSLGIGIPWWAKIGAKLVLSRLPIDYRWWSRLGLFKHGAMEDFSYAQQTFRLHFERCRPAPGFTCLEVGPGDSLFSAVIACSYGARRVYLVDAGPFANTDPEPYCRLARELAAQGLPCPAIHDAKSLADVLAMCNAIYVTDGLAGLARLHSGSVDFIWSQAVLEHIRRSEFVPYMRELRRLLKPGGRASHRIDLRDHLGGALNNLRFSEALWETDWFANSGFYTNRIQFSRMCTDFREAGHGVEVLGVDRWQDLPTPRAVLAEPFRSVSDDELLVQGFDVLLTGGGAH